MRSLTRGHTSGYPDYRNEADGNFPHARELVPKCLDLCTVTTIRKFFRKTWRYMDAYQYVPFLRARICD